MDIRSFYNEFYDLSKERKSRFLTKLFSQIIDDPNYHEDLLMMDILPGFIEAEENDYFGTEGFDG